MKKLKAFRKRHKLSQKACAELLGYKVRTWQEYEQGRLPTPDNLYQHIKHYDELVKLKKD